jgi:hypothetical protein
MLGCRVRRRVGVVAFSLSLLLPVRAGGGLVDAVVAEVDGTVVTASDVALARALGLFGLAPSQGKLLAGDLARYVDAWLVVLEARQLGIIPDARARAEAWEAAARRFDGDTGLLAWLDRIGVSQDWAQRAVAANLEWRQFIDLRFRAIAFVPERELSEALGPGSHPPATRARVRARLEAEAASRSLETWLDQARARVPIRWILLRADGVENPLPPREP